MRPIRNTLTAASLLFMGMCAPAFAGFLQFPLHGCGDAACTVNYTAHGAYTANALNSILDHHMKLNSINNYYPYGKYSDGGGDKMITAFNGESVAGMSKDLDETCIRGTVFIHPDWNPSVRMTNDRGCGLAGYASYDEHPGYDYRADAGKPVYAAAAGTVISTLCYMGNTSSDSCSSWGAVGINHGNGYISQYFHMNTTLVSSGQTVAAGQQIGTVGGRRGPGRAPLPAHLHFEVRHIGPTIGAEVYPIVDPYGWVGGGTDPLYSASWVAPTNLWQ